MFVECIRILLIATAMRILYYTISFVGTTQYFVFKTSLFPRRNYDNSRADADPSKTIKQVCEH